MERGHGRERKVIEMKVGGRFTKDRGTAHLHREVYAHCDMNALPGRAPISSHALSCSLILLRRRCTDILLKNFFFFFFENTMFKIGCTVRLVAHNRTLG